MPFTLDPLAPPRRLLLGPGPSETAPEVLDILSTPLLGHLDPAFLGIMDEIMEGLRTLFQTRNRLTLPISGTGTAAMEAAVSNLVEPGDRVVIGICGYFGTRLAEMCRHRGAEVVAVEATWGTPVDTEAMISAVAAAPTKAAAIVHAETSTGVLQPLGDIATAVRDQNGYLIVDTVTSLGGVPLDVDGGLARIGGEPGQGERPLPAGARDPDREHALLPRLRRPAAPLHHPEERRLDPGHSGQ